MSRLVSRTLSLLVIALFVAGAGAQAGAAPKGDPPGNNGTVKIDQSDTPDEDKGNEPIGDNCLFWLKFYGFDNGQRADITFAAHAPTGGKPAITDKGNGFGQPGDGVLISMDAAGGGQDDDETVPYNLSAYVDGLKAHAQHGYHIKLTTTIKNSDGTAVPGGVKHKVFWIKCTPAPPVTLRVAKATTGNASGTFTFNVACNHQPLANVAPFAVVAGNYHDITGVPVGTYCEVTETPSVEPTKGKTIEETPASGDSTDGKVTTIAGTPIQLVKFTNAYDGDGGTPLPEDIGSRPPAGNPSDSGSTSGAVGGTGTDVAGSTTETGANPGTDVLGATETQPEPHPTLARTGNDLRPLATTGLWSVAAGGLALLAGRRLRRRA